MKSCAICGATNENLVKTKTFSNRRMAAIYKASKTLNVNTGALKKALQTVENKGVTNTST